MKVAVFLVAFIAGGTFASVTMHALAHQFNTAQATMAFFLVINLLICMWEICLSLHIASIRAEYKTLLAKHGKNPVQAVLNLMSRDLSLAEMLTLKTWASIWSVYSLYDTSYSNQESFGFFVDFGNGWVTILPTALMLVGMTFHGIVSARVLGLINLVAFYQECYGTVMYVVSYLFNKRYVDRSPVECALVVGISNSLWFFFPIYGMYLCYDLIVTDSYSVFL